MKEESDTSQITNAKENDTSKGEDEIPSLLKELNETAIYALNNDDNENALECLKRAEQLLEVITSEGKDIDRNIIIIVLYNIACCY